MREKWREKLERQPNLGKEDAIIFLPEVEGTWISRYNISSDTEWSLNFISFSHVFCKSFFLLPLFVFLCFLFFFFLFSASYFRLPLLLFSNTSCRELNTDNVILKTELHSIKSFFLYHFVFFKNDVHFYVTFLVKFNLVGFFIMSWQMFSLFPELQLSAHLHIFP